MAFAGRTFLFSAVYVPLLFVLALGSAIMIHSLSHKTANVARTLFLMPFAITSVTSAIIGMFLLDPRNGLINAILKSVGVPAQQFLGSPSQALYCIVIVLLWINLGYNMVIFLSAVKEIPRDYFEAANIDGATNWQAFRHDYIPFAKGYEHIYFDRHDDRFLPGAGSNYGDDEGRASQFDASECLVHF